MKTLHACSFALCAFGFGALGSACFTAELDPDAPNSFACCTNDDCPGEQTCVAKTCSLDREGQDPRITTVRCPENLSILTTANCATSNADEFRIEIELERGDGQADLEIVGTLDGSPLQIDQSTGTVEPVARPVEAGIHRIHVELRDQSSGSVLPNPGAVFDSTFWIDDGREHIAIISPRPGSDIRPGQDFSMEVAALNFSYRHSTCPHQDFRQGHLHVYRDVNVEQCFPLDANDEPCDPDWFATLMPERDCDEGDVPLFTAGTTADGNGENPAIFPDNVQPGPTRLSILAEKTNHIGYVREDEANGLGENCIGPNPDPECPRDEDNNVEHPVCQGADCVIDSIEINVVNDECTGQI